MTASIGAAATQATIDAYAAAVAPSMLSATEPPSCLAGGVTTRGDVARVAAVDFKPSWVQLGVPPLTATMDRSEVEHAAACVVRVCQVRGDTWQPVLWSDVLTVFMADVSARREPFVSLVRNPFFRPQADALVLYGYATWVGEPRAVELTLKGLEALRRWVRPPVAAEVGETIATGIVEGHATERGDVAPVPAVCKCGHARDEHTTGSMGNPGRCDHGSHNVGLARIRGCECRRYGSAPTEVL